MIAPNIVWPLPLYVKFCWRELNKKEQLFKRSYNLSFFQQSVVSLLFINWLLRPHLGQICEVIHEVLLTLKLHSQPNHYSLIPQIWFLYLRKKEKTNNLPVWYKITPKLTPSFTFYFIKLWFCVERKSSKMRIEFKTGKFVKRTVLIDTLFSSKMKCSFWVDNRFSKTQNSWVTKPLMSEIVLVKDRVLKRITQRVFYISDSYFMTNIIPIFMANTFVPPLETGTRTLMRQ